MSALFAQRSATSLFVAGGLAVLFGIVASAWPTRTALVLVILWAIYALVDGILALVLAFRSEGKSSRVLLVVNGVVGILAGVLVLARPVSGAVTLAWVLGLWLIVHGVVEIMGAFSDTGKRRWLVALSGVLWILAGALFMARPGAAALTISLWLGVLAIAWGLLLVGAGLATRAQRKADGQDTRPSKSAKPAKSTR